MGVLGCMAQRAEEEIFARAGHVDLVCGTRKIQRLPELVAEVRARRAQGLAPREQRLLEVGTDEAVAVDRSREPYAGGTVGYLTVMRGCDLNCTFCIVPRVRGRVQSRPIEDLLAEARWMVAGGAKVITLLGQTVNAYGEDLPAPPPAPVARRGEGRGGRPALADLLRELDALAGPRAHPPHHAPSELRDARPAVDRGVPEGRSLPAAAGAVGLGRPAAHAPRVHLRPLPRARRAPREAVPDIEPRLGLDRGLPGESEAGLRGARRSSRSSARSRTSSSSTASAFETRAYELADDVPDEVKSARNQVLLCGRPSASLWPLTSVASERSLDVCVEEYLRAGARPPRALRHNLSVSFPGDPERLGTEVRRRVEGASPFGLWGTAGA